MANPVEIISPASNKLVVNADGSINTTAAAGTAVLGKVGIDQTTPGTTNNVTTTGRLVTKTDKSGTITSGGVAQTAIATNASRTGFMIQNQSTGDLWFSSVATAVAASPSIKIPAGQMYESPGHGVAAGNISIIGATTGQAFAAREW